MIRYLLCIIVSYLMCKLFKLIYSDFDMKSYLFGVLAIVILSIANAIIDNIRSK